MADGTSERDPLISLTYVIGGAFSLISCATILLSFAGTPALSQFPSSMLRYRLVCDLLLSAQFVLLNLPMPLLDQETGAAACSPALAFLAQFALFGSLSWFGCLSLDLYLSVTRPFTRPSSRLGAYQLWAWAGSTLTGLVYAARHADSHDCWMSGGDAHVTLGPLGSGQLWMLFFGWLAGYMVLSVTVLTYVQSKLLVGGDTLRKRLLPRLTAVNASRAYTAAFSLYWASVGAVFLGMVLTKGNRVLHAIFSCLLSLLGSWDAAVWVFVQRRFNPATLTLCCQPIFGGGGDLVGKGSMPPRSRWLRNESNNTNKAFTPRRLTMTDSDMGSTPSVCDVSSDNGSSPANGNSPDLLEAAGVKFVGSTAMRESHGSDGAPPTPLEPIPDGSDAGGSAEGDISDVLRREFVRQTIVGIVTSTRTVNAEAACASPVFNSAAYSLDGGNRFHAASSVRASHGHVSKELSKLRTPLLAEQYVGERPDESDFSKRLSASGGGGGGEFTSPAAYSSYVPSEPDSGGFESGTCTEDEWQALIDRLHSYPEGGAAEAGAAGDGPMQPSPANNTSNGVDPLIRHLTSSDFNEVSTIELSEGVYFQDYAPMVWQALRQAVYHVPFPQYLKSLMGSNAKQMEDYIETMVGNFSEGGSGGFFFLSADRKYLIKTLTREEQRVLLRMLPRYYEYLRTSPRTLLCRFYGCYAITMHSQTVYFVCMESLFHSSKQIHEKYDLKGSWVDRSTKRTTSSGKADSKDSSSGTAKTTGGGAAAAKPQDGACASSLGAVPSPAKGKVGEPATRKDNDLTKKLKLPPSAAAALRHQCSMDAELLRSLNVMDYSLLLGVHHPSLAAESQKQMAYGLLSPWQASRNSDTYDDEESAPSGAADFIVGSPRKASSAEQTPGSLTSPIRGRPRENSLKSGVASAFTSPTSVYNRSLAFTAESEGGAIYYIGIIDMFQEWTLAKRLERLVKVALWCRWGSRANGMSVVEPKAYSERFNRMIERITGTSGKE